MSSDHPSYRVTTTQPHRIRLPAPWQVTRLPGARASPAQSSVVFQRNFQRPTGLTAQSALALEVTLLEPLAINVALNGVPCSINRRSDVAFEVPLSADQMRPVNELEITVEVPAEAAPLEQPRFGQDYVSQVQIVLS